MYAFLRNNEVHEVIAMTPEDFARYYPEAFRNQCVVCPDGTEPGWVYDGESCAPPPPAPLPSLQEARAAKLAEVMAAYSDAFSPLEAVYPREEREGWSLQEAEAQELLDDPAAETPVLSLLVQLRGNGETVSDLAAKVLQHAREYRMLYAALTGQQQRMYGEVNALAAREGASAAEILAFPVAYTLPDVEPAADGGTE
jgi:hypothetical protein